MKKNMFTLLCGIAAIVVTVVVYLAIFGFSLWGAIHFVTLLAVILAEAITTAYAFFANGSPRRVGAAVFSAIMIPVSVSLSIVYIIGFPKNYGAYLGWYFLGTVLVNVICLLLYFFDTNKEKENKALQAAKGNMLELRKLVKCIQVLPGAQPYKARLYALEEKLHYSNDSVIRSEDFQIQSMLLELQQTLNQNGDGDALLSQIELMVTQRGIMTSP